MHCKLEETGGTKGRARTTSTSFTLWAARYNTWLLIKLTPKGVVFSFFSFSTEPAVLCKRFVTTRARTYCEMFRILVWEGSEAFGGL